MRVGSIRRIAENWQLKVLALALALLLWIVVSAEQVTTTWLLVPLEVRNTDPNYRLDALDAPKEVEVRLSGRARDLFDLIFRRPSFVLSLSDIQNPVETRFLDPRMLQLPPRMEVSPLDVRPSSVRLEFTRIGLKRVPIRARLAGQLGPGWAVIDTLTGDPSFIDLSGPSQLLAPIDEVFTVPIEISPGDSVIGRTISIDTAGLAGLTLSAGETLISGRIDRVVERLFPNVAIVAPPGTRIEPARVNVTLRGPQSTLRSVVPASIRVVTESAELPAGIPPGGVVVALRVERLSAGVMAILSPDRVRVLPPAGQATPDSAQATSDSDRAGERPLPE